MRSGQRVIIIAPSNTFRGARGSIFSVHQDGSAALLLDSERVPMTFEPSAFAVVVGEASEPSLTGAE